MVAEMVPESDRDVVRDADGSVVSESVDDNVPVADCVRVPEGSVDALRVSEAELELDRDFDLGRDGDTVALIIAV